MPSNEKRRPGKAANPKSLAGDTPIVPLMHVCGVCTKAGAPHTHMPAVLRDLVRPELLAKAKRRNQMAKVYMLRREQLRAHAERRKPWGDA